MTTFSKITELLNMAETYMGDNSNAVFCYRHGCAALAENRLGDAIYWALRSIKHSLGVFSCAYDDAVELASSI